MIINKPLVCGREYKVVFLGVVNKIDVSNIFPIPPEVVHLVRLSHQQKQFASSADSEWASNKLFNVKVFILIPRH